jgi:hypothetical protein
MPDDAPAIARQAWRNASPSHRKRVYAAVWAHRAFGESQADLLAELSARVERFRTAGDEALAGVYEAAIALLEAEVELTLEG